MTGGSTGATGTAAGSTGGGLGTAAAADTSGLTLGTLLVVFQISRPPTTSTAAPPRPSQTARLPRAICVVPQACEAVLVAGFCDCALAGPISPSEMPLELKTLEMRSA